MQERGEGEKRVHTAVEREWNEKIGEAVPSACLSPLLLQCLWFIGGMMAGQGKGQLWRFGRRSKQGKAGDWFVIVVLCGLLCQQAALLTAVIEKSNTVHISACHVPFISSYVSWVFLYRKRKEEAAVVMSGLKRWRKESGGNATSSHLGALVAQRISSYFPLALRDVDLVAAHCLSIFPFTTGLDYITMHSLTHLLHVLTSQQMVNWVLQKTLARKITLALGWKYIVQ